MSASLKLLESLAFLIGGALALAFAADWLAGAPWESLQYYPLRDFWRDGKQMISA